MSKQLNKATRGSNGNRYRYESVAERLASINIDVIHRVVPLAEYSAQQQIDEKSDQTQASTPSLFVIALKEWRELDCTGDFVKVWKALQPVASGSLAQVLFHKQQIVNVLCTGLRVETSLAHKTFLSLIGTLVKDLRDEVAPHFPDFFQSMLPLTWHADPEVVEAAFSTLLYLFKFLSRHLCQNMNLTFTLFKPLIQAHLQTRAHVRKFGAECFAYLLRKLRSGEEGTMPLKEAIAMLLIDHVAVGQCHAQHREASIDAMAHLLYETMKNVHGRLHSRADQVLSVCLSQLDATIENEKPFVFDVIQKATMRTLIHAEKDYTLPLWNVLSAGLSLGSPYLLRLVTQCVALRHGQRFPSTVRTKLYQWLTEQWKSTLFESMSSIGLFHEQVLVYHNVSIVEQLMQLSLSVVLYTPNEEVVSYCAPFFQLLWQQSNHAQVVLAFVSSILKNEQSNETLKTLAMNGIFAFCRSASLELTIMALALLNDTITVPEAITQRLESFIAKSMSDLNANKTSLLHLLPLLPRFKSSSSVSLIVSLLKQLEQDTSCSSLPLFVAVAIETYYQLAPKDSSNSTLIWNNASKHFSNTQVLVAYSHYVAQLDRSNSFFESFTMSSLLPMMEPALNSPDSRQRESALLILSHCNANHEKNIFQLCLQLEQTPATMQSYREKIIHLTSLVQWLKNGYIHRDFLPYIATYLSALFSVKFSLVWPAVQEALVEMASILGGEMALAVWKLLMSRLQQLEEKEDVSAPHNASAVSSLPIKKKTLLHFSDAGWESLDDQFQAELKSFTVPSAALEQLLRDEELSFSHYAATDSLQWHQLILKCLSAMPQMAERQSRVLVPMYLRLYHKFHGQGMEDIAEEEDDNEENVTIPIPDTVSNVSRGLMKNQILNYLTLFAQFKNPKALYQSSAVYSSFLSLLSRGDPTLQKSAFLSLVPYHKQQLTEDMQVTLESLCDESSFRETLTRLSLEKDSLPESFVPVLVRLLYGKMIYRKSGVLRQRRKAVLAFVASCSSQVHDAFMSLLLEPFNEIVASLNDSNLDSVPRLNVSIRIQLGFLNVLDSIWRYFGRFVLHHVPVLIQLMLVIARDAQICLESSANDQQHIHLLQARQLCARRFAILFLLDLPLDLSIYVPWIHRFLIAPRLNRFAQELSQSTNGVLEVLGVWSQREAYRPFFLQCDKTLLGALVGCISQPSASMQVIHALFEIMQNILADTNLSQELIPLNSHAILNHFKLYLLKNKKELKQTLSLLSLMAPFWVVEDPDSWVDMLVPLLKSVRISETDTHLNLLNILVPFVKSLGSPLKRTLFKSLIHLLGLYEQLNVRQKFICLMTELLAEDESMTHIVAMIIALNSYSGKRLDEPDYQQRFDTYRSLTPEATQSWSVLQWQCLLHQMIFDLSLEDFSIRNNSVTALNQFVGVTLPCIALDNQEYLALVTHILIPAVKRLVQSSPHAAVRIEAMKLLNQMILHLSDRVPDLSCLKECVDAQDEEVSLLLNLCHLQLHRQQRALKRFSSICSNIAPSWLQSLFMPWFMHILFSADEKKDSNLIQETIHALALLASCLPWRGYDQLLRRLLRAMDKKADVKAVVKALVAVVNVWKFSCEGAEMEPVVQFTEQDKQALREAEKEVDLEEVDEDEEKEMIPIVAPISTDSQSEAAIEMEVSHDSTEKLATRIHRAVVHRILPSLQRHLTATSKDDTEAITLRTPVALAMTTLLLHLPKQSLTLQLPKLLLFIIHLLKDKQESIRASARDTLIKMAVQLGSDYLGFIVTHCQQVLLRGSHLHVLGFTVEALVRTLNPLPGSLDYCMPQLLDLAEHDLFGLVEDKESQDWTQRWMEAKHQKGEVLFQHLASIISFEQVAHLVAVMKRVLSMNGTTQHVQRVRVLFKRLATGWQANSAWTITQQFQFIKGLFYESWTGSENVTASNAVDRNEALFQRNWKIIAKAKDALPDSSENCSKMNAYLWTELALTCLQMVLKRGTLESEYFSELESFVPVLSESLTAKQHTAITAQATMCLHLMTPYPLSVWQQQDALQQRCFNLLSRSSKDPSSALIKLLSFLLKQSQFNDKKLAHKLLQWLMTLDVMPLAGYVYLKSLMNQKIILPDVYTIMTERFMREMVTSTDTHIQEQCRNCLLCFLLDYPMSEKKLKQHLQWLIQQLNYVHVQGRLSVLQFLEAFLMKMDTKMLSSSSLMIQEFCQMLFPALCLVWMNETDANCKSLMSRNLGLLWRHCASVKQEWIQLCLQWLKETSGLFIPVACHCLSLAMQVDKDLDLKTLFPLLEQCLDREDWEMIYHPLLLLEKCPTLPPFLIEKALTLLNHSHHWIRSAVIRLFGCHCDALTFDLDQVKQWIRGFVKGLESKYLEEAIALQLVKNLVFLMKWLKQVNDNVDRVESEDESENDSENEGDNSSDESDSSDEMSVKQSHLYWLLRFQLAPLARRSLQQLKHRPTVPLTLLSLLQFYAALISNLSTNIPLLESLTPHLLDLFIRLETTETSSSLVNVMAFSQQVMQLLRETLTPLSFQNYYNSFIRRKSERKARRVAQRAQEAVVNPEKVALQRLKKSGKKKEARERKRERLKGMPSSKKRRLMRE